MNDEKMKITTSMINEVFDQEKNVVFSESDMDRLFEETDALLDEVFIDIDTAPKEERIKPKKKSRRNLKTFAVVAASVILCTVAVTEGVLNITEPYRHATVNDAQQNISGEQKNTAEEQRPKDSITTDGGQTQQPEKRVQVPAKESQQDNKNVETGKIVFSGGECSCGHLNPDSAKVVGAQANKNGYKWSIENKKGNTVNSGTGNKITKELTNLYKNKRDGNYVVLFSFTDKNGNEIEIFKGLVIDSGEIKAGEYE